MYKPYTLLARCSRNPKIRENAIREYIRFYRNCKGYDEELANMICFCNYKDTREKAVQKLVSEKTIRSLSILREAEIDSNFKDTKELIAKKIVELDNCYRLFDKHVDYQMYIMGMKDLMKMLKEDGFSDEERIELSKIEQFQIPQLSEERRKEIKNQIKRLDEALNTNRDWEFAKETNFTRARLVRHDLDSIENIGLQTTFEGDLIKWEENLLVCMVRSVDAKTRIEIFDQLLKDSVHWKAGLYDKICKFGSYGFKHCRNDDKKLATHILDKAEKENVFPAIADASKYLKIKKLRDRALKFLIEKESFNALASVASEGNFMTSFDAFAACLILAVKESDEAKYKEKVKAINSVIKRPNPSLRDWFFPWMNRVWHKSIDQHADRAFDFSKSPKIAQIKNGFGKHIYAAVDSLIGTYYFAKLLTLYVIGSTWLRSQYFKMLLR
jgi:hypothetical protein